MKRKLKNNFTSNLSYAFVAQLISLMLSILMSLIVPKLLGVEQFSYWQLFIFYSTYVGLFHFGLPDGIYLRYGGYEFDEIDKPILGSQLRLMFLIHSIICVSGVIILSFINLDNGRRYVWILTGIYLVITNAFWYFGFIFQATNRTKIFSIATIISKLFFAICVLILMFLKPNNFKIYVFLYVISQAIALGYCIYQGREIVTAKFVSLKRAFSEMIINVKIGIKLTLSNLASSFILGVGRAMIDSSYGISSFGIVSLSISLTNFFLQFISQVSIVMFPMLRRFEQEKMINVFVVLRSGISYLLCAILVFYVPIKYVLSLWLPQYILSLNFLAVLLPICIFDGKMQLLYNTYLKVMRKEKVLLLINGISLVISIILCSIGNYLIRSMFVVVICMVIAVVVRSIITSIYLSKLMNIPNDNNVFWECILSIIFVIANLYLSMTVAFLLYIVAFMVYCTCTKNILKKCICSIIQN